METDEQIKFIDSVILSQKIIHRGLFFKLLKDGGEILMDDPKRGIRIIIQGDFVNVQYLAHNQAPKFKTQVYKTMAQQKENFTKLKENLQAKEKQTQLQTDIQEGGSLW